MLDVATPWRRGKELFLSLKLRHQLALIMSISIMVALSASLWLGLSLERRLLKRVDATTDDLVRALQVSAEELTTQGATDQERITDLITTLRRGGIVEMSLIGPDSTVVASSDPEQTGRRISQLSESSNGFTALRQGRYGRDIVLPLVMEDNRVGQVHLVINLEHIFGLVRANNYKRVLASLLIFSLGALGTIGMAARYAGPIAQVAQAAKMVAAGNLASVPQAARGDEIGELNRAFNHMVKKLMEHRELEKRLADARRLSQIGQLASGIAHEVRNPLNSVNLSADYLRDRFLPLLKERQAEFLKVVDRMKGEVTRVNRMVNNFLELGKPQRLSLTPCNLNRFVEEWVEKTRGRTLAIGVELEFRAERDLPVLPLDTEQLETCLQNFLANSLQAMRGQGRICLTTRFIPDSRQVEITFSDDGAGIAPENLERVFEPYFTTKEAGIGLGLAVTKRVVEEHGGAIAIDSRLGEGTRVTLSLPVPSQPMAG